MAGTSAVSIRIPLRDRDLIDIAAGVLNKSRTEFMLDSARAAATDALLDRRLFMLSAQDFRDFEETLAKAPTLDEISAEIRKRPSPWLE